MKKHEFEIPVNQIRLGKPMIKVRLYHGNNTYGLTSIVPISVNGKIHFRLLDSFMGEKSDIFVENGTFYGNRFRIRTAEAKDYSWNEKKVTFGRKIYPRYLVIEIEEKEQD